MNAPYFARYDNLHGEFTHYEIQTVRELLIARTVLEAGGNFDAVTTQKACDRQSDALGPVLYGVYGRNPNGTAEHLFNRASKEAAEETLTKMGVSI